MKASECGNGMFAMVLVNIQISRGLSMKANGITEIHGDVVLSMIEMGMLCMKESG